MAGGAVLAAAAASGRATRSHGSAPLPTSVMPVRKSVTARKALDQSSRYADLSLDEATLVKNGKHVLGGLHHEAEGQEPESHRNVSFWPCISTVYRLTLR